MVRSKADQLQKQLRAAFDELEKEYDCVFRLGAFGYSEADSGFRITVSGVLLTEPVACTQELLVGGFAQPGTQFWVEQDRDGEWYKAVLIESKGALYIYDLIGFEKSTYRYKFQFGKGRPPFYMELPDGAYASREQAKIIQQRYSL